MGANNLYVIPFESIPGFGFIIGRGDGEPQRNSDYGDDLGYADLSSYGNDRFDTPHLDRLARNGLKFTDFHSNGAVCTPTRASLLTGRYPHRAGLQNVIYASFNSNRQQGPLRGRKGSVWEGGHRVPAIAWWPGRISTGTTDQLALSMDLMPTMLELAGVDTPDALTLDGRSLVPVLLNGKSLPERTVFWNWPHRGNKAVRRGPWKLVLNEKGVEKPKLFHLGKDLGERKNVAGKYPERVNRLRTEFRHWKKEVTTGSTDQPEKKMDPPEWLTD